MKFLKQLLKKLNHRRFRSFFHFIESLMEEMKTHRSNLKLYDNNSLNDLEKSLLDVETRLTSRMNDERRHAAPLKLNRQLQRTFNQTVDALRNFLITLSHYQQKNDVRERQKTAAVEVNEEPSETTETSHSSVRDDVLIELARGAYEKQ